jgi:hypothetical protein
MQPEASTGILLLRWCSVGCCCSAAAGCGVKDGSNTSTLQEWCLRQEVSQRWRRQLANVLSEGDAIYAQTRRKLLLSFVPLEREGQTCRSLKTAPLLT